MYERGYNVDRIINSIGQGGFFVEKFIEFNVVYDCGTDSDIKILKTKIDKCFAKNKKKEKIDLVFVSHLHRDHINGLPYLLDNYEVKQIVLPYLTDKEIQVDLLSFAISTDGLSSGDDDFLGTFIERPEEALESKGYETKIVRVLSEEVSEDGGGEIYSPAELLDHKEIKSGTKIYLGMHCWIYIPYNYNNKKYFSDLDNEFKSTSIKGMPDTYEKVKELYSKKTTKDEIKKVYGTVFKDKVNESSMILYSGESCDDLRHSGFYHHSYGRNFVSKFLREIYALCGNVKNYCPYHNNERYINNGCLYTGDYVINDESKWHEVKVRYKKVWRNIGLIQIPHHASKHNFCDEIVKENCFFFFCAGIDNRHNHPHGVVLNSCMSYKKLLLWVNEEDRSELHFLIN